MPTGIYKRTEETKRRMSIAQKGERYALGCHHSEKSKIEESEARKDKNNPMFGKPAWNKGLKCLYVSERMRGNKHCLGKHPSEESRRKMSETKKGLVPKNILDGSLFKKTWKGGIKVARRKARFKRRSLGFILLNSYKEDCEFHHLDNNYGIYMPKEAHRSIYHSVYRNINMDKINALAFNYLKN